MQCIRTLALLGAALCLSACSGASESLGFGRNPPDEFAVVERPPLSLPPDFSLRPPQPGAPRPQEISMPARANETLFGGTAQKPASASDGGTEKSDAENALLTSAGAAKAEPGIREIVDRETTQKIVGSKKLIDDLLWWREPSSASATVNAGEEAQRLKEAKEKGASINAGATPVIEKGSSGWLGQ
ncbi:MAG: DUF3035 domain-containing protein [Bdellovibrionales bacterium]|jgi:hypothetical protein